MRAAILEAPRQLTVHEVDERGWPHVQPAALTLFTEGTLRHEITLTDLRPTPLRITAVQTIIAGVKAHALEPERNAQGQTVTKIIVEASADLPPGRHEDTLTIFTDDPAYRQLQLPVRRRRVSRLD